MSMDWVKPVAWQAKGSDGIWRYVEMPRTAAGMGMEIRGLVPVENPAPQTNVVDSIEDMLRAFGHTDYIREGSRSDYVTASEWEDYIEVPKHVLERIRAALDQQLQHHLRVTDAMVDEVLQSYDFGTFKSATNTGRKKMRAALEAALAVASPSPSTRAISPTSTQEQEGSDE